MKKMIVLLFLVIFSVGANAYYRDPIRAEIVRVERIWPDQNRYECRYELRSRRDGYRRMCYENRYYDIRPEYRVTYRYRGRYDTIITDYHPRGRYIWIE